MPPRNLQIILIACFIAAICYNTAQRTRRAILVGDAIDLIDRYYVDPIDSGSLIEGAMAGLTSQLDRHSEFIPAEMYSAFNDVIQQEFAGIGILVEQPEAGKPVRVVTPLVGSPALLAGILPGDEIVAVGGENVSEMDIRDVSTRLRGPVGSQTTVRVRRGDGDDAQEVEIRLTRQSISLESVVGDYRDENNRWVFRLRQHPRIAYVHITSFGEKTEGELRTVLRDLDNDFDSLVIDVRGNAGGLLQSAVNVCDFLIDEGRIVTIKSRGGTIDSLYDATPGMLVRGDIPVAVLIDGNSASASEIVAACLQDHGRARIIGTRSYGKGTVQNVLPLEFGRSALKLTTARYYRPNGRNIHRIDDAGEDQEWGVSPDEGLSVSMSDEAYQELLKSWQRASFPVSSRTGDTEAPAVIPPVGVTAPAPNDATAPDEASGATEASGETEGRVIDPQLRKAIEVLSGQPQSEPATIPQAA
jgi:carboxyl-terminal processing protease